MSCLLENPHLWCVCLFWGKLIRLLISGLYCEWLNCVAVDRTLYFVVASFVFYISKQIQQQQIQWRSQTDALTADGRHEHLLAVLEWVSNKTREISLAETRFRAEIIIFYNINCSLYRTKIIIIFLEIIRKTRKVTENLGIWQKSLKSRHLSKITASVFPWLSVVVPSNRLFRSWKVEWGDVYICSSEQELK